MDLENFESVWQRVTASDEALPVPEPPEPNVPNLCVIKRSPKSCAILFIPE